MADPTVLILDDEERWLALHERRIGQAGIPYRSTQLAKDAIEIAKNYASIRYALIDEILYVPPVPVDPDLQERQRWQGSDVIREIYAKRPEIGIIIVTSAPLLRSKEDTQKFRQETAKLRRQRGVIDIVHKQDIEEELDDSYGWIIDLIKRTPLNAPTETTKPKVLVGIGVPSEILDGAKYKRLRSCLRDLGSSEYEIDQAVERFLDHLPTIEKTLLIEMPGSRKLDRCTAIKANSQTFQILEVLARRAERRSDLLIREQDYRFVPRRPQKSIDPESGIDTQAVKDFAYGYDDNGQKRIKSGVQIEGKLEAPSRLKVAIHRLGQQLDLLNIGSARHLFLFEGEGYRPMFETGIILYSVKS